MAKPTTKPVASGALSANNLAAIPATNYTLQLSGASRQDTLEAFAKKILMETTLFIKPSVMVILGMYSSMVTIVI